MKKRIAMILAVIATVSTLGSNAVMARSPACVHPNATDSYAGVTFASYKNESVHTWYDVHELYCPTCEEVVGRYEQAVAEGAHSKDSFVSGTRVDDPDHEGYYWYETTYHCDDCDSDFTVIE